MKTRGFTRAAAMVAAAPRTLTAVAATAAIVGGGLTLISNGVVSAHTPNAKVDCAGITVSGKAYDAGATLTLTVNGTTQGPEPAGSDGKFELSAVFNEYGMNTWSYVIDSQDDDKYDVSASGEKMGCKGETTTTTVPPNPCDPSTYPGGTSVEEMITKTGKKCVDLTHTVECGSFSAVISQNDTPYNFGVSYSVGSLAFNFDTDASNVSFAEDENGGTVNVWYWAVGPESGFFTPLGLAWFNVSAVGPIAVDTDCEDDTTTTTTVEETTTTVEETTTTTEPKTPTNEPTIDITALAPVCQNGAPYIHAIVDGSAELTGRTATIEFIDVNGDVVETHTRTFAPGALMIFIYPGASVDGNGNPTDWPGWSFDGDDWVLDPSDDHLRDGLTVRISINPTATGTVEYPAATEDCADPLIVEVSPLAPTPEAPTPEAPEQQLSGTLPATGTNTVLIAGIAAALAAFGGAAIVIGRRRTIDA